MKPNSSYNKDVHNEVTVHRVQVVEDVHGEAGVQEDQVVEVAHDSQPSSGQ